MDKPFIEKYDEVYNIGNTTIYIVAPNPAPTQEKVEKILADYKRASLEIWKEQLLKMSKEGASCL
jgi:hypothetical protein